jgi:ketosteroid isomerase-like protein
MPVNVEQEVLAEEENLTNATRSLDIPALERIYADDVLMTSVLGDTCTKSSVIDEAKRGAEQRASAAATGKHFEGSYDKEDLKVVSLGDNAVTSYRFVVKVKGQNIHVHRRYRTTNVWARRHGSWQVVAAHTAFVLDPKQVASLEQQGASSTGTS